MPIVNILKKASNYVLGSENCKNDEFIYEDNEILFCKNNVCVHPPALVRQEADILHYPGYLTVTTKTFIDQYNNAKRPTLFLTWIPNSTLRKCPSTVENSLSNSNGMLFQRKLSEDSNIALLKNNVPIIKYNSTNPFIEHMNASSNKIINPENSDSAASISPSSDKTSICNSLSSRDEVVASVNGIDDEVFTSEAPEDNCLNENQNQDDKEMQELKNELQPLLSEDAHKTDTVMKSLICPQKSVTSVNITIANPCIENQSIPVTETIDAVARNEKLRSISVGSMEENGTTNWMTPELLAYKHNLTFPESANASPLINRKMATMKCRRFSVDLSQMRSLRLFFNDENCTSGQLVIASRESQYKILHFHHGGLDHLAQVLHQWHSLLHNIKLAPGQDEPNLPYRQFMVCRPEVKKSELHPDEENVNKVTTDYFYGTLLNEKGQIEDDLLLRKCVFFGGLERSLRKTVWPFLLHCYSFNSTFEDRVALREIRRQEYEEITRRRLYSMSPEEQAHFWRTVQCIVEKDVVRTDRGNPFFAGEDNPNIEIMKNILLNYAFYNSNLS